MELKDSTALRQAPDELRSRFREEGYLFFRGLLLREEDWGVLCEQLLTDLVRRGWLAGTDLRPRQGITAREADETWLEWYADLQRLESFHSLAYAPRLLDVVREVVTGPVIVHPRKIGRLTFPASEYPTPAHQDFPLIQGSGDAVTAWLPLAGCSPVAGGLRVLVGSHRAGLRRTHAEHGVGGLAVETDPSDPAWASTDYQPGDVLVFHCFTVHWAPPNRGEGIRLSADYRYQSVLEPIASASLEPHYWPRVAGWDELTRHWSTRRWVEVPGGVVHAEEG